MANTTFIDTITPITAAWLNDVNNFVYGTAPNLRARGSVTATSGQTVFTVPFAYVPGSLELVVYISGINQILGTSYTETSTTSVTFSEAVPVNCVVDFVKY
jgi:hypothetical protein